MFQFNHAATPARTPFPHGSSSELHRPAQDRLLLSWGEHCIECAAPACYASCDLYAPTETGKCRRIEGGIRPVANGTGAELRFKRWAKLEAQGNIRLFPPGPAHRLEQLMLIAARAAHPLGRLASRLTGTSRWANAPEALWRRLNRWFVRHPTGDGRVPNQVVLDAINCSAEPAELTLSIAVDKLRLGRDLQASQLPPPFAATITLPPGPSRHTLSALGAEAIFTSALPFNLSLAPSGDDTPHLIVRQLEVLHEPGLQPDAPQRTLGATTLAKLVIFDLDNTLWEGVLLEGSVRLRPGIRALFEELDARGVLLSVASKNAPADALAQLAALRLDDLLLFPQIGWLPKSRSVQAIVEAIDIGIDTVIFVDDNPFERAEVAAAHPAVEVLDELALSELANHPRLQGAKTPEARQRRQMYQQSVARRQAETAYGSDYRAFLQQSALRVTIRPPAPADHERIAELVQRTNQLNFSGRKYDRSAISAALGDERIHLVIECADRFGSYGTVGFCMARVEHNGGAARLVIDDFMLSCRVQGKFIEQALIHDLISRMEQRPAEVRVNFRKTDRNRPAQLVLEEIGFETVADGTYRLDPRAADLSVPFMTVIAQ